MKADVIQATTRAAAALCLWACCHGAGAQTRPVKDVAQPTGTTGATAFQPGGAAKGEAEAGTSAQNGDAGMREQAKPGFDNKPPANAKAGCARPQGGVDASGGENINSSSKDNTSCTGKADRKASRK